MANDTPDQAAPGAAPEADNSHDVHDAHHDVHHDVQATPTNDSLSIHPLPSIDETRAEDGHDTPRLSQQGTRDPIANPRLAEILGASRSGGALDRSTSTRTPRPILRRGSDIAEDVLDHPGEESPRTRRPHAATISARNAPASGSLKRINTNRSSNAPKPGELRRAETRSREEQWVRTVAGPTGVDLQSPSQDGNGDGLRPLPSLRRRATGRPRGDSHVSVLPSAPGEAGPDPNFSLAGPNDAITANLPFVERGYAVLNPAYEQPLNTRPVWGLAKPLPRVVRPGMVPSLSELNTNQQQQQQQPQQPEADTEADEKRRKASNAWNMALAAARNRKGRALSQAPAEGDEGENRRRPTSGISPGRRPSAVSPGIAEPAESGQYLTPPILEHPEEGGAEPFPDLESSPTEYFDEQQEELLPPVNYGDEIHNHHTEWSVIRTRFREPLAELLAVIVQLTLGFCADLSVTASTTQAAGDTTAWAWGLASMVAIYIAGGISGAHLNPGISIMLWIYRGFPLRQVPRYVFAQVLGAFIAALISFGIYRDVILNFGGQDLANGGTAADFVTFPRYTFVTKPTAFFNEFVATAFLAVAVMALGDDTNAPPGAGMNAFVLGLVITVITMAFGHNTGAACNPSRDFGPRLALLALGYGNVLFTDPYWFYGPWVACITGAIFGAGMYDIAIFTGGESPINYPIPKMKRAARKWRIRMRDRFRRLPAKLGIRRKKLGDGYEETEGKGVDPRYDSGRMV